MREFTIGAIAAGLVFALIGFWPDIRYGASTASAQIGASATQDTIDFVYGGKVGKAVHTSTDTVVADKVLSLPEYTSSNRPTCDGSTDVGNASGQPWVIVNTTTSLVEHCNDADGSWGWDPLGLDGDGDGLKRFNSAGTTVDEDDDDPNNQPVRGDFTIPDGTVGDPGTSDRTVTYSVPDGVYGSGDEVSFTMPGDSDLTADNIKYGEDIFGTTGTLRYEETTTYSGTNVQLTVGANTGYVWGNSNDAQRCAAVVLCREKGDLSLSSFTTSTMGPRIILNNPSQPCNSFGNFFDYFVGGTALTATYNTVSLSGSVTGATCVGTEGA